MRPQRTSEIIGDEAISKRDAAQKIGQKKTHGVGNHVFIR